MRTNKGGRPTTYNQEIAKAICRKISTSSKGIRKICKENDGFPNPDTIFEWMLDHPEFSEQYTQAKRTQVQYLIDEIIEISDNSEKDTTKNEDGKTICNMEYINRCRLRIDTRKWIACKLAPKLYGDKVNHEVNMIKPEDAIKELA
jgi:hypothetical protein